MLDAGWRCPLILVAARSCWRPGWRCCSSALFVYFRDIQPIWEVVSQIIFYASPVIVAVDKVQEVPARHAVPSLHAQPAGGDLPAVPPRDHHPRDAERRPPARLRRADRGAGRRSWSRSSSSGSTCSTGWRQRWPRTCRLPAALRSPSRNRSSASIRASQRYSAAVARPAVAEPARSCGSTSPRRSASVTDVGVGGRHQAVLAVEAEVTVAVRVGADERRCRRPSPRARADRTPRGVEVCTNTVARA